MKHPTAATTTITTNINSFVACGITLCAKIQIWMMIED
jgi:hypothetical protein